MNLPAGPDGDGHGPSFRSRDLRFIGAASGFCALAVRAIDKGEDLLPCQLCSISTRTLVVLAPITAGEGALVIARFAEFGTLQGRISRRLPSGFVLELILTEPERKLLGSRIDWENRRARSLVPDRRSVKRIVPRQNRSVVIEADGRSTPCLVTDISPMGAAIAASMSPAPGSAVAIGRMVGRVTRTIEAGFAVQFIQRHPLDQLDRLLLPHAARADWSTDAYRS